MARSRKKSDNTQQSFPAWMITFSDLTTLLMTFFVMLVSIASMTDVYKRKVALGSVSGKFGTGAPSLDDLTTEDDKKRMIDPGPINMFKDLQEIRDRLWEDPDADLRFESNRFIQRVSIDVEALFAPGTASLSSRGLEILQMLAPVVAQSAYPLGLSGHTGAGRDEFGPDFVPRRDEAVDFSWRLSLERVVTVYRFFRETGVDAQAMRLEGFGRFKPRAGDTTIADRNANMRVEITLDKRIGSWNPEFAAQEVQRKAEEKKEQSFSVDDFIFRFDLPEQE